MPWKDSHYAGSRDQNTGSQALPVSANQKQIAGMRSTRQESPPRTYEKRRPGYVVPLN
jgi:hypothetical protein